jgi:DNA-binding XRE family transcriptional regulator
MPYQYSLSVTEHELTTEQRCTIAALRRDARSGGLQGRRQRLGLTAAELAAEAGVHPVTVRRVERAKTRPDATTALAIASALDRLGVSGR